MYIRILVAAVCAGIASNLFIFQSLTITTVVLMALIFTALLFILFQKKKAITALPLLGNLFFLGLLTQYRASPFVHILLGFGISVTVLLLWYTIITKKMTVDTFWETLMIPFRLFGSYIKAIFSNELTQTIKPELNNNSLLFSLNRQVLYNTVLGLFAGLPIVFVLFILFASADPIFGKTVEHFLNTLNIPNMGKLGTRVLLSIGAGCMVLPIAFMQLSSRIHSPVSSIAKPQYKIPFTVIMTMIALTLLLFLVIQWPYVFAHVQKEQSLIQFGITTYSEYVKRGFMEFLLLASFIYGLIWMGYIAFRGSQSSKKSFLFIVQTSVIVLFTIFLLSVLRRIFLYWEFHGLTLIRFYGGLFLLWVGMLTGTMFLRSIYRYPWIRLELIVSFLLLLGVGIVNVEEFIVLNHPPTVNGNIDSVYLSRLSADGYTGWIQAYKMSEQTINELIQKPDTLQSEDRRKLANAGLTLGLLNNNYFHFLKLYATEVEKKDAVKLMSSSFLTEIPHLFQLYQDSLNILNQTQESIKTMADPYIVIYGDKKITLSDHIQKISQLKSKMTTYTEASTASYLNHFTPRSSYALINYGSNPICAYVYRSSEISINHFSTCIPVFYSFQEAPTQNTSLETFFLWNSKEFQVYQQLKKEIPFVLFMQTQSQYSQLWKKVLAQDENERHYDQDVSYYTPLIKPLD